MKALCLTLCLATAIMAGPAHAGEVVTSWAKGVTQEAGWRDYDKKFDGSDNEQCWAITAGNLIDWWQEQSADKLPTDTPRGKAVLHTFMQSFTNAGSDPDEAINWWFTGEYKPGRDDCAQQKENTPGAFLKEILPEQTGIRGNLLKALRGNQVTATSATAALIDGAKDGAAFWIGVSYVSPKGRPAMHSLNVWGVAHSTTEHGFPHVCGIWIADSDDYKHGLTYVPVKEEKGMLIFNSPEHPIYGQIPCIKIDTLTRLDALPKVQK